MTDLWRCPRCGRHPDRCQCRPPPADHRVLQATYIDFRRDCCALEELIARAPTDGTEALTPEDLKRLGKAVTVMKVAFKIVKKVLRVHDLDTKHREPESTEVAP